MKKTTIFRNKALFSGLFVVVIICLASTVVPAINGSTTVEIKKNKFIPTQKEKANPKNAFEYDLSLNFQSCKYKGLEAGISNDYAVYEVVYSIKNVGTKRYLGFCDVFMFVDNPDIDIPFRYWNTELLNLDPGSERNNLKHEIKVITNADPLIDEERGFAGHIIFMMIKFQEFFDGNPVNNLDVTIAQYWIKEDEYDPTNPQIEISEPGNITQQGLIDPPYVLRMRERLGWKYTFACKRAELWALRLNISIQRLIILGVPINLIKSIDDFLVALNDTDNFDFWDLWDLLQAAKVATEEIINIILNKPVEKAMRAYDKKQNEFEIWYAQKHWNFNITIRGSIFKCEANEKITIRCREKSKTYYADKYGIVEKFELNNIPCIYYNNEKSCDQHKCIITIIGDKHKDEIIQSRDVLSFSHSDGIIDMDFEFTTDPCCFPAGTQITMADGTYKNIEDIRVGEKVLSYDIDNDEHSNWRVKMLGKPVHPVMTVNDDLVQATVDHPFYVKKDDGRQGWAAYNPVDAATAITYRGEILNLEIGDYLYSSDGEWITIENIEFRPEPVQTYNLLSFSGKHNYFANGVLVYEEHPPQCITDYILDLIGNKYPLLEQSFKENYIFQYLYPYLP